MKTNTLLIGLLTVLTFSSCSKKNDEPFVDSELEYSFLVAGHVYGSPTEFTLGIYPPFKEHFEYIKDQQDLNLAIFTGDVVRSNNSIVQWDSVLSDMSSLNVEYHIAPGNHDRGETFNNLFGQTYYSFQKSDDLFIILNPVQWNIKDEQKDFLIDALSDTEEIDNIFIFCHELIWWSPDSIFQNIEINSVLHYPGSSNYWSEIDPILQSSNKPTYIFSGDCGATWQSSPFAYYNYENIHLVASGMGHYLHSNYLLVKVKNNGEVQIDLKAVEGFMDRFGNITDYVLP